MKRKRSPILVVIAAFGLLATPLSGAEQRRSSSADATSQVEQTASDSLLERLDLEDLWATNALGNWLSPLLGVLVGLILGKIAASLLRWFGRRLDERGWTVQEHAQNLNLRILEEFEKAGI